MNPHKAQLFPYLFMPSNIIRDYMYIHKMTVSEPPFDMFWDFMDKEITEQEDKISAVLYKETKNYLIIIY